MSHNTIAAFTESTVRHDGTHMTIRIQRSVAPPAADIVLVKTFSDVNARSAATNETTIHVPDLAALLEPVLDYLNGSPLIDPALSRAEIDPVDLALAEDDARAPRDSDFAPEPRSMPTGEFTDTRSDPNFIPEVPASTVLDEATFDADADLPEHVQPAPSQAEAIAAVAAAPKRARKS